MEYGAKSLVIGLDLGGTNSVFGVVDSKGEIIATTSIKTQAYPSVDQYIMESVKAIKQIAEQVGGMEKIRAMGIGAPCGNYYKGTIEHAANLVWAKGIVPLANMFVNELGIPVVVTNDAKAAAMGEMKYGAAVGMNNFVELTLGTGVGSGIVANGQLIYGFDGFAGELGHMIVEPDGRPCGCGRKGCLETYCSATGVVRTAIAMLEESSETTSLRDIATDKLTSYEVYKAAMAGDTMAQEVFKQTGRRIGIACANIATFLSPEAFIFFGGLAQAGELLLRPIEEAYNENVLSLYKGKARFLMSGLDGANAAILGASAIAWDLK
ncbi:glucokinase [Prevotella sp. P3-120]|uniref:ROK family protein n=1 Tax=unclassified Prevotella TaxID=2638335 RepID=UPI000B9679CE|nr:MULTISPECIES: ROK family protein [unclassified Prevotella]OYP48863.1 glucokinase [Prevotella sp. P3-120]OYP52336.1 glucokinase [Prevotella sp. P3-92]